MKDDKSIWKSSLNLVFVYVVVFLCGLVTVLLMTSILNNSVKEITDTYALGLGINNIKL